MRTPSRPRPTTLSRFTPLAAALAAVLAPDAFAACTAVAYPDPNPVYCVTNDLPFGAGSFQDAFNAAKSNWNSSPTIKFDLVGTGPFTISPSAPLQHSCFSGAVHTTIDGESQTGWSQNTDSAGFNANLPIKINGTQTLFTSDEFGYGCSLTFKGVSLENFTYGGGTAVSGLVNIYGSQVLNSTKGVHPRGSGSFRSQIGGALPSQRNLISGHSMAGVDVCCEQGQVDILNNVITASGKGVILASTASSVNIEDNIIRGNATSGVSINNSTSVGIRRNYISGNSGDGIYLSGAQGVTIENNKIGLSMSGADGNGGHGIYSQSGSFPTYASKN